jgi:hypothetical protein
MVTELLLEPLLLLGLDEVGRRGVGVLPALLQVHRGPNARRRGPGAVRWAPQCCTNVTPSHERDTGELAHWSQPGGGTSSS